MKFEFSNCVSFQVDNPDDAKSFYEKVLGMKFTNEDAGFQFAKCGKLDFFVEKNRGELGPFLDFIVDDVEAAKEHLLKNGCEVYQWDEKGNFIKDPFGLIFNLYSKK